MRPMPTQSSASDRITHHASLPSHDRLLSVKTPLIGGLVTLNNVFIGLIARWSGYRMLDHRVRTGIDEPGLAVVELHQVGRRSLVAVHLDDLAVLVRVTHDAAVNADAVANRCLHVRTSSSR